MSKCIEHNSNSSAREWDALKDYPIPRHVTDEVSVQPRILPLGETAVSIEFGNVIERKTNDKVQALFRQLRSIRHPGLTALNPTYRSLFVKYDPFQCSYESLLLIIERCLSIQQGPNASENSPIVEIPVCYGDEFGLDLGDVASFHGLSKRQVIYLHSLPLYFVYMIGFTPGFPYLGDLDERLFTPRKKEPRQKVPAGSVGIAGRQTGIYPLESPGGWQLIGRTPVRLFDLTKSEPFSLKPGDRVKFVSISREKYDGFQDS